MTENGREEKHCYFIQTLLHSDLMAEADAAEGSGDESRSLLRQLDRFSGHLKEGDCVVAMDLTRDGKEASLKELRLYLANWRSRGVLLAARPGEQDQPLCWSEALDQLSVDFVLSQQHHLSPLCLDDRLSSSAPLRNSVLLLGPSDALILLTASHRLRRR